MRKWATLRMLSATCQDKTVKVYFISNIPLLFDWFADTHGRNYDKGKENDDEWCGVH
jgi:hypothetical protein